MDFIVSFIKLFVSFIHDLTGGNQWLTTAIFAGLAIVLRKIPGQLFELILRQLTINMRVSDRNVNARSETIDAVLLYLRRNSSTNFQRTFMVNESARLRDERLISGEGNHWVKALGCWIIVNLTIDKNEKGELRILTLKTCFWNRANLKHILNEVNPQEYDLPLIYEMRDNWLYRTGIVPKVFSTQTQLIDDHLYQRIDSIFNRFCNDEDYYLKHQKLRKETFLLYGPPGTGKTTLFRHLASKYSLSVVILTPDKLSEGIREIARDRLGKVLILIDDVVIPTPLTELFSPSTKPAADNSIDEVTRVLLNELDGIKPLHEVIVAVTTNNISKLPPAVYRPGRVDHLIEFDYPNKETVMSAIGFDKHDDRYVYLSNLKVKDIPLDNIASLRNAETLSDVIKIIDARDNYLKLSLHANTNK